MILLSCYTPECVWRENRMSYFSALNGLIISALKRNHYFYGRKQGRKKGIRKMGENGHESETSCSHYSSLNFVSCELCKIVAHLLRPSQYNIWFLAHRWALPLSVTHTIAFCVLTAPPCRFAVSPFRRPDDWGSLGWESTQGYTVKEWQPSC